MVSAFRGSGQKEMELEGSGGTWLNRRQRTMLIVLFGAGIVVWAILALFFKIPIELDEGQHLIGGRYMLLDSSYMTRVLRFVGGYPDWTQEARSFYTFPPVWDGFLALSIGVFGLTTVAHGFWLMVAMATMVVSVWVVARRLFDKDIALLAVTLLVWCRPGFRDGLLLEAEPQVAAFGMAALACVVVGTMQERFRWFAAGGACLGTALLLKLWLALPSALLVFGILCYSLWTRKNQTRVVKQWAVFTLCTVVVGALHLAWVGVVAPNDFGTWVHIYLKPVVERFADESDPAAKPLWFYGAVIYRDFVFLGGLLIAFILALTENRPWTSFARILMLSLVMAVVAMSLFGKKESLYLYPLVPIWCLCAAVGARWLVERYPSNARTGFFCRIGVAVWGGLLIGLSAVVLWVWARELGGARWFDGWFALGHVMIGCVLGIGLLAWVWLALPTAYGLVMGFVVANLCWGGVMAAERFGDFHDNTSRALATYFGASMASVPPDAGDITPRYISALSGVHAYWLWKKGRPWYYDDERHLSGDEVRMRFGDAIEFYEIERSFKASLGGPPTEEIFNAMVVWLETHTDEVTDRIEARTGRKLATRVFVPRPHGLLR